MRKSKTLIPQQSTDPVVVETYTKIESVFIQTLNNKTDLSVSSFLLNLIQGNEEEYEKIELSDADGAQNEVEPENVIKYKKLPLKDKIMMGPLDKYQKHSNLCLCHLPYRPVPMEIPGAYPSRYADDRAGLDAE